MRKFCYFFLIFFTMMSVAAAQESPQGRYCGHIFHNGVMVTMSVVFAKNKDGLLEGAVHYNDNGKVTLAVLREASEYSNPSQPTSRLMTFIWSDIYGTGLAKLDFDEHFLTFSGKWGARFEEPHLPWSGKQCDMTS